MDVVVVSAYADDRTAEEYADDYYDYGGFGVGKEKPAVYCFCTIWTDRASQEENVIFLLQGQ